MKWFFKSGIEWAFDRAREDIEYTNEKLIKKHTLDGYNTFDLVAMSLKAYHIIIFKRIDMDDLVESESYENYVKKTNALYDKVVAPLKTMDKEEWLEKWLIDEETYDFLKENLQWNN